MPAAATASATSTIRSSRTISARPAAKGAADCTIKLGAASRPITTRKRAGPNSASGTVPRAIDHLPFPVA